MQRKMNVGQVKPDVKKDLSCLQAAPLSSSRYSPYGRMRDIRGALKNFAAPIPRIETLRGDEARGSGFTLIELLVVVLIIGILAAVAVPQYKVAVMKSRVATLRPLLAAVVNAQKAYHLANGTYATEFDELSVDAPAGWTIGHTGGATPAAYAKKGDLRIYTLYGEHMEARIQKGATEDTLTLVYSLARGSYQCLAYTDTADKVCKSMGPYQYTSTSEGYTAYAIAL